MSILLVLIFFATVAHFAYNWWDTRNQRAEEVAAMEAISLHTRPILIRSQFIGDADVEQRYQLVRDRIEYADNGFVTPDDVHMEVYNTRTNGSRAFVDFEMWADLVEEKHRQRVHVWETARSQNMAVKGGEKIGLTEKGKRAFNGQRTPEKERFTIEF